MMRLPRQRERRSVTLATVVQPSLASWVGQAARDAELTVAQWLRDEIMRTRHRRQVAVRQRARRSGDYA